MNPAKPEDRVVPISIKRNHPTALLCIPHAGAGAAVFYSWSYALQGMASVWAACLPGRENRSFEEPLPTIEAIADSLLCGVASLPARQLIIFGHCSGALVAYELAYRLALNKSSPPCTGLIISAQPFPDDSPRDDDPGIADLPLPQLLDRLREIDGMPEAALANQELMEAVVPTIRADLRAAEQYRIPHGRPLLNLPIMAVGGTEDQHAEVAQLASWKTVTAGEFRLEFLNGGHFYLQMQPKHLQEVIQEFLKDYVKMAVIDPRTVSCPSRQSGFSSVK